ncbi:hypothetical protein DMI62_10680 [Escherichia coli]|nr:hypothetical protein [Escherichia coli]
MVNGFASWVGGFMSDMQHTAITDIGACSDLYIIQPLHSNHNERQIPTSSARRTSPITKRCYRRSIALDRFCGKGHGMERKTSDILTSTINDLLMTLGTVLLALCKSFSMQKSGVFVMRNTAKELKKNIK